MPTPEMGTSKGRFELKEKNKHPNTVEKFRTYRLWAESNEKKLKEAETVIQTLRNEINFKVDDQKNLINQLSSAQNRITCLQQTLSKFLSVSGQQRRNEELGQKIDQKIEELRENFNTTRLASQNILRSASKELDLLKKIKALESALNVKDRDYDLLKMEMLTLAQQKKNMETEHKLKNLESELEKSITKKTEEVIHFRETSKFYEQQIEDYEQKIQQYENERKSFLEDFELPADLESNAKNLKMADNKATKIAERRSPSFKKTRQTLTEMNKADTSIFLCSPLPKKPKLVRTKKEKEPNLPRTSVRPQLEFLTQTLPVHPSKDSSQTTNSAECGRKRRLFSTNCNHYID